MPKSEKPISMDVEDIFPDPDKVVAMLEAGTIIHLLDDDGRVLAVIEPIPKKQKTKPKKKPRKTS